jgi:hypothetical protein
MKGVLMKKLSFVISAVFVAVFAISTAVAPATYALNGKASLGGGSGIYYGATSTSTTNCTLTAIGYDSSNNLVGISAGHCADNAATNDPTWANVTAEKDTDAGVIGTVVYKVFAGHGLGIFSPQPNWNDAKNKDYVVILFNKDKVVPQKTVGGVTISSVAPGSPAVLTQVCKIGRTSGKTCGMVARVNSPQTFDTQSMNSSGGDSGSPVVSSNGTLYGAVHGPVFIGFSYGTQSMTMAPMINDINARGGIGAGFTPVQ